MMSIIHLPNVKVRVQQLPILVVSYVEVKSLLLYLVVDVVHRLLDLQFATVDNEVILSPIKFGFWVENEPDRYTVWVVLEHPINLLLIFRVRCLRCISH